jgi:hypothetical protein
MFAIELYLFLIGTIAVPTHTEPIPTTNYIPNTIIAELIIKQPIKSVGVLTMKLTIPPNIVKQHLLETFFHLEVGEMIVDETPIRE